jgi:hypothetical protein
MVSLAVFSQLIPVSHSNPPATAGLQAPQEINEILTRACFDCHSNNTVWPWYSWVAPVSWLVALDVHEGRAHLNFSTWGEYSLEKQAKLQKRIGRAVNEGDMPPFQYLPAHSEARLSEKEKNVLLDWVGFTGR